MLMNALAIQRHVPKYLDPIVLKRGDVVVLGAMSTEPEWPNWIWATHLGKSGWIPTQIVDDRGCVSEDYSAVELAVEVGDHLLVLHSLNGWHWARHALHKTTGWVPESCVQLLGN